MSALMRPSPPPDWPSVVYGMDINAYQSMPGISKTGLDLIARSPAHYHGAYLHPGKPLRRVKPGQLEGTLAHCAVLEPGEFSKRYVTIPEDAPRRPTQAQWDAKKPSPESLMAMAWWSEFNERNDKREVISAAQYETAMRQADSLRALPEVAEALSAGQPEVSAFWIDPRTGAKCRCRPDWRNRMPGGSILLDVKTCGDASKDEFRRQIPRKRYQVQDAFYTDGFEIASGEEVFGFVFAAVESEWPYVACAHMLDEDSAHAGRKAYRRHLETYTRCVNDDIWPGYSSRIELIRLSEWDLNKYTD